MSPQHTLINEKVSPRWALGVSLLRHSEGFHYSAPSAELWLPTWWKPNESERFRWMGGVGFDQEGQTSLSWTKTSRGCWHPEDHGLTPILLCPPQILFSSACMSKAVEPSVQKPRLSKWCKIKATIRFRVSSFYFFLFVVKYFTQPVSKLNKCYIL